MCHMMDQLDFSPEAAVKACASLEKFEKEFPDVQKILKQWIEQRKKTISRVNTLREELDTIAQRSNVARGLGASASILGALANIYELSRTYVGGAVNANLLNTSTCISMLGSTTSMSATLIELGMSRTIIEEIKMELKKDRELAQLLFYYFQRSQTLESLLKKIFGCSIMSDTIQNVMAICSECVTILQIGGTEITNLIRDITCGCFGDNTDILDHVGENVCNFLRLIQQHPDVREPLHKIFNILQKNPLIFEFSKLSLTIVLEMGSAMSCDIFPALLTVAGLGLSKTSPGILITTGAFNAIKIAMNVLSIIFAAKNIKEGKSKYSEQLEQLGVVLSMELNTVLNNCKVKTS